MVPTTLIVRVVGITGYSPLREGSSNLMGGWQIHTKSPGWVLCVDLVKGHAGSGNDRRLWLSRVVNYHACEDLIRHFNSLRSSLCKNKWR